MDEFVEEIKKFKFIEEGKSIITEEMKNDSIDFLHFLIVFAGGYSKYMGTNNNIFNQSLNIWIIKMKEVGFNQRKLNGLCLRFGYGLKTED